MLYFVTKFLLFIVLTIPMPLVGWYFSIGYLHGALERLWLAPILLVVCLSLPCLGFAILHPRIYGNKINIYVSAHLALIMGGMFLIIIFKKYIELYFNLIFKNILRALM